MESLQEAAAADLAQGHPLSVSNTLCSDQTTSLRDSQVESCIWDLQFQILLTAMWLLALTSHNLPYFRWVSHDVKSLAAYLYPECRSISHFGAGIARQDAYTTLQWSNQSLRFLASTAIAPDVHTVTAGYISGLNFWGLHCREAEGSRPLLVFTCTNRLLPSHWSLHFRGAFSWALLAISA